jgi:hypothetical protein
MKRFINIFSVIVISLFALSVFGWMSVHISKGDKQFGVLNEPVEFMYSFLDQFQKTVKEVKKKSPTFLKTEKKHKPINQLDFDLKLLTTYSESDNKRAVAIRNLRNDEINYKWSIPERVKPHDRFVFFLCL